MPYLAPAYTADEAGQHRAFSALLNALSYPGRPFRLPAGDPCEHIGRALLDLETSYYTPDSKLDAVLSQTGARPLLPERASYHFYPDSVDLEAAGSASMGNMLYPDGAATLIVRCDFSGTVYEFSGPGVQGSIRVPLNLPHTFWSLRERAIYPLGWDVILTDGQRIIGIPRTTRVVPLTAEEA
jgi:alpha-D-ribose 1-methylphosphonate 5-triphosphate synthase subunit PhnH